MIIKSLFERDIEQHIAPVIFFNQKDPETIQKEVSEYVFTSSNTRSIEKDKGIHEQLLKLLSGIINTIEKKEKLPASWVSGFYGSGKSSLAKLIGLCLDDFRLPDGNLLVDAFFKRNDSGKVKELIDSFQKIKQLTDNKTFSIVFDVGASSKAEEHIPLVAYRELLKRLGYSKFESIAYYEILLEEEGRYTEFQELCQRNYSKDWDELKDTRRARDVFSNLYHLLKPDEYKEPHSWHHTNYTKVKTENESIEDLVSEIKRCISHRMQGYTLFIVIDEVSQYIGKDGNRMLQLQSFTQEIGGKGDSKIWLIVTGQEKLEETAKSSELFKLKDRFPPYLRVYLEPTNVKEIIRRRLLRKNYAGREQLETIFTEGNISKLKLYAWGDSHDFQKEELIDFYPLLPSYIDLILQVSNGIRIRSASAQRDTGGVRSALQISHDILNERQYDLKNQRVGALVNISHIFSIVSGSLDNDMKMTIPDIRKKCENQGEDFFYDVAKCIILLEYVEGIHPVKEELITRLLYPNIGSESISEKVMQGIRFLEEHKFIQYTEKSGWKIRGSISQEWEKEKAQIAIDEGRIQRLVYDTMKDTFTKLGSFIYQELSFPYEYYKNDTDKFKAEQTPNIKVQLPFFENKNVDYIQKSKTSISTNTNEKRLIWVPNNTSTVQELARAALCSEVMVGRYNKENLDQTRKRLLLEEKSNIETMKMKLNTALEKSLLSGSFYCNGKSYAISHSTQRLSEALQRVVSDSIADIFPQLHDGLFKITKNDLDELMAPEILTCKKEFLEGPKSLGIFKRDQKKYIFSASGTLPTKIGDFCRTGKFGSSVVVHFSSEPFGYSPDLIKLCLIALVRAGILQIIGKTGDKYTSIRDSGFKEIFTKENEFKNATFIPYDEQKSLDPRSRNRCSLFFKDQLDISQPIANDIDSLADSVFQYFTFILSRIGDIKKQFISLGLHLDPIIEEAEDTVLKCKKSRFAEEVVRYLYDHLEILERGIQKLKEIEFSLTDETKTEIIKLKNILKYEYNQLREIEKHRELETFAESIEHHLNSNRPYGDLADYGKAYQEIRNFYLIERKAIIKSKNDNYSEKENQIRNRTIFSEISVDERATVLKPLQDSNHFIDEEATAPSLLQIEKIKNDIEKAAKESHRILDEIYNDSSIQKQVVTVSIPFLFNEITTIEQLDSYLFSFRERCEQEISQGRIIRFQ